MVIASAVFTSRWRISWPLADFEKSAFDVRVHGPNGPCFPSDRARIGRSTGMRVERLVIEAGENTFTLDGFYRTGDLVRTVWIDGERCVTFEGRLKDNINRGGEKYGAEEVEALIAKHPAILDARVVAMPDRFYGERGCAYLVIRPGQLAPSAAELANFLTGFGLAKYKCPERIETLNEFPVTRVGKVDKIALRQWIAAIVTGEQLGKP